MYAYETDGYGRYNLMDDANIPNLTTLPYIDWCSAFDPVYLATRRFTLSKDNPFFFSGRYAAGLGSPHTPYGYVWPLGIIGRALTATSSAEVAAAITTLAETDEGKRLDSREFLCRRLLALHAPRIRLGERAGRRTPLSQLSGRFGDPVCMNGPIEPFERRSRTPTLVPTLVQIENAAELNATLGRLLHVTGGAIPHAPK